jgi:protein TonB
MEATLGTLHAYHPDRGGSRRTTGVIFVIGIHILLIYGLVTGLHRDFAKIIPKMLIAVEVPPEILPPPPPPPKKIEPPSSKAPPEAKPDFVPPPEVAVATPSPVQIEAAPTPPPEPAVIAPPAPVVADTSPTPADIRVACPYMVKPDMPRKALMDGTTGIVRATVIIRNGAVKDVTNLTGPKVFYAAVRAAMLQYRCEANAGDVVASQEFNFKLVE